MRSFLKYGISKPRKNWLVVLGSTWQMSAVEHPRSLGNIKTVGISEKICAPGFASILFPKASFLKKTAKHNGIIKRRVNTREPNEHRRRHCWECSRVSHLRRNIAVYIDLSHTVEKNLCQILRPCRLTRCYGAHARCSLAEIVKYV